MPGGYMNPKYGELMGEGKENTNEQAPGKPASKEAGKRAGHDKLPPHIHIHTHENGHTVHTLHHDGGHSKQDFAHGDHDGLAEHVRAQMAGEGAAPEGHEMGETGGAPMLAGER